MELTAEKSLKAITNEDFKAVAKKGSNVFKAKVVASNIIDYVKDGITRQLALVDCLIGDGITTGVTSPTMVSIILANPDKEIQLTYTGERYSEFAKETQPVFDLKIKH